MRHAGLCASAGTPGRIAHSRTDREPRRLEAESTKELREAGRIRECNRLSPAKLQSILQNGLVHHRAGRLAEAEALYGQAKAAAPKNFDVLFLCGLMARQQNRVAEAIDLLSRALKLNPSAVMCELRLAGVLLSARRSREAEQHLRHALTLKADFHEAWDQLADCLKAQDRLAEAISCHEKAVAVKPDFPAGWVNFGFTLRLSGRPADALRCHERAAKIDPHFAPARFGRAQALQQLHQVREAVAEYDAFLQMQPHAHEARSNRLFAMHNLEEVTRAELFAAHVAYGRALGAFVPPVFTNEPKADKRLRIAILSPDLRAHSCAYFIEPLLRHLDREQFEVYLYHDHIREDAVSARLHSLAVVWRNFSGQTTAIVEQHIRADNLDVLIDLAGHTGLINRLPVLARKVAPVQINYLGYPDTTGVPAVDYRFTDAIADPEGEADAFATEQLVRFGPTAWTYQPPADSPDVAPPPCLVNGYVTFGSFNDLAKITDTTLAVWSRVVGSVPASRLRLKGRGLSDAPLRAALAQRLVGAGIALERVEFLERTPDTVSHLAQYHTVDVALDTFPYHGTTTTCEALWMGVPVVSRVGDHHVARVGASLLTAAGHPEWSTATADEYVGAAVTLASDAARLQEIRRGLRDDLSHGPLLDHQAQSGRFGSALRTCWAHWCERHVESTVLAKK